MNIPQKRYICISEAGIVESDTYDEIATGASESVTYMRVYPLPPVLSETEAIARVCQRALESRCAIVAISQYPIHLDVGMIDPIVALLKSEIVRHYRNARTIDLRNGSRIFFGTTSNRYQLHGLDIDLAWTHGSIPENFRQHLRVAFHGKPIEIIETF